MFFGNDINNIINNNDHSSPPSFDTDHQDVVDPLQETTTLHGMNETTGSYKYGIYRVRSDDSDNNNGPPMMTATTNYRPTWDTDSDVDDEDDDDDDVVDSARLHAYCDEAIAYLQAKKVQAEQEQQEQEQQGAAQRLWRQMLESHKRKLPQDDVDDIDDISSLQQHKKKKARTADHQGSVQAFQHEDDDVGKEDQAPAGTWFVPPGTTPPNYYSHKTKVHVLVDMNAKLLSVPPVAVSYSSHGHSHPGGMPATHDDPVLLLENDHDDVHHHEHAAPPPYASPMYETMPSHVVPDTCVPNDDDDDDDDHMDPWMESLLQSPIEDF